MIKQVNDTLNFEQMQAEISACLSGTILLNLQKKPIAIKGLKI